MADSAPHALVSLLLSEEGATFFLAPKKRKHRKGKDKRKRTDTIYIALAELLQKPLSIGPSRTRSRSRHEVHDIPYNVNELGLQRDLDCVLYSTGF